MLRRQHTGARRPDSTFKAKNDPLPQINTTRFGMKKFFIYVSQDEYEMKGVFVKKMLGIGSSVTNERRDKLFKECKQLKRKRRMMMLLMTKEKCLAKMLLLMLLISSKGNVVEDDHTFRTMC